MLAQQRRQGWKWRQRRCDARWKSRQRWERRQRWPCWNRRIGRHWRVCRYGYRRRSAWRRDWRNARRSCWRRARRYGCRRHERRRANRRSRSERREDVHWLIQGGRKDNCRSEDCRRRCGDTCPRCASSSATCSRATAEARLAARTAWRLLRSPLNNSRVEVAFPDRLDVEVRPSPRPDVDALGSTAVDICHNPLALTRHVSSRQA